MFGAWLSLGLFYFLQTYLHAAVSESRVWWGGVWHVHLMATLFDAAVWTVLTPVIVQLSRRFQFRRGDLFHPAAAHCLSGALLSAAGGTADWLFLSWIGGHMDVRPSAFAVSTLFPTFLFYWVAVGITHAVELYRAGRAAEINTIELREQLASTQLEAIRMGVQPHFLFNTLNAISELVHEDPRRADEMIAQLGTLLHLTVGFPGVQEVELKHELTRLGAYVDIERMRFQGRLSVRIDADPETLHARVPNLILQPLVERAIRLRVAPHSGPGRVHVRTRRDLDALVVRVADVGQRREVGREEEMELARVRERLRRLYGAAHRLDVERHADGTVTASLQIPFRTTAQR
ncbi:MAG TPA: histidine kinase [Longimicrobiaceae bacterium]|nr:histidine kinase [Longimicrobiaceae bacterium]